MTTKSNVWVRMAAAVQLISSPARSIRRICNDRLPSSLTTGIPVWTHSHSEKIDSHQYDNRCPVRLLVLMQVQMCLQLQILEMATINLK